MTTVREAALDLLRSRGMTTCFGNPGSTELPFLQRWPADFRYVLGLQESVVVGMADGYAQISGLPTLVNLHTAPGVGHAMGAISNARHSKAPLVITAGQQRRAVMTMESLLVHREAATTPRPAVKWSYEPPRAQEVPHALARAIHLAATGPRGPVFLSIPMDDWEADADAGWTRPALERTVSGRTAPDPAALDEVAAVLGRAGAPALVAGADVDASGGWDAAVALAERLRLPVWAAPLAGRCGFPQDHPAFRGELPPAIGPLGEALGGHDVVLVAGAPVFAYYPHVPGPFLADGTSLIALTDDPDEAARAPAGDAVLGDVRLALEGLLARVGASDRPAPEPVTAWPVPEPQRPLLPGTLFTTLADVLPDDAIVALESPSNTLVFRQHVRIRRPASYLFGASGGLGFGLSAAVGAQLAAPDRRVVAVIGDGSLQYAVQGLWTAVAQRLPLTIVVPRNDEYAILKWFGDLEGVPGSPGLDLPGLDTAAIARGYGVTTHRAETAEELRDVLGGAIASDGVELVEVPIAPGMGTA